MNLTRLVALGLLADRGARHGHQLRRDVEVMNADEWAGAGAGSLHRELRQMAAEGLIEAIRTERVGRRPERTIYQITNEGRRELAVLRDRAIGRIQPGTDAVAVGLIFAGLGDRAALAGLLALHRSAVEAELERLALDRQRGMREGFLQPAVSPLQAAAFRRSELRMQAELAWHRECDELVAGVPGQDSEASGAAKAVDAAAPGPSS
jgi:DNA-binding PadR family transcriptional regulator